MLFKMCHIFGNEFIPKALEKHVSGGQHADGGFNCLKHFPQFMCKFHFGEKIKKKTVKNPLAKLVHFSR